MAHVSRKPHTQHILIYLDYIWDLILHVGQYSPEGVSQEHMMVLTELAFSVFGLTSAAYSVRQGFTENAMFRMSSVQFQSNVKQEYMHTPLKCVVKIAESKFDPL